MHPGGPIRWSHCDLPNMDAPDKIPAGGMMSPNKSSSGFFCDAYQMLVWRPMTKAQNPTQKRYGVWPEGPVRTSYWD
jgi:hypothetical protein